MPFLQKMKQKKILHFFAVIFITTVFLGYFLNNFKAVNLYLFSKLSPQEKYEVLVKQKDMAIEKAVAEGNYHCCIKPPCSMCYMQANEWNNFTPGTCACDDLIARGKKPCPECQKGNCKSEDSGFCETNY